MTRNQTTPRNLLRVAFFLAALVAFTIAFLALTPIRQTPVSKALPRHGSAHRAGAPTDLIVPPLPLFLPVVTFDAGAHDARAIAVADLNHDGKLDVVIADESGVGVLLGNGDGTLKAPSTYNSGGTFGIDVKVADVNHDGKPDIVVLNQCGIDDGNCRFPTIGVLLGNGDGTFQPVVTYDPSPGASGPHTIALADLNGDGKLDIVVSNSILTGTEGGVAVLLGNGDGTFQPATSYGSGGYGANGMTVADLNGDGKADIIVINLCTQFCPAQLGEGSVAVLLGNGDGTFQPAVSYDPDSWDADAVVVADLNADGKPDALVMGCRGSDGQVGCNWSTVSVLLGNGDGTFQSAVPYYIYYGSNTSALAAADVNGDGKLDVVVTDAALLGNGDGTFQAAQSTGSNNVFGVALGDMNGDGLPDLLASDFCNADCSNAGVDVQLHVGTTATTTSLTSTPNPSVYGQATFTATVTSGSGTPTGTVILYDESYGGEVATGTLSGGTVTIPTFVQVGTEPIVAVYQGSLQHHPSISPVVEQVVTKATTTTSTASSVNPGIVDKPVVYTVSITSQYGGGAGGNVSCLDNGSALGAGRNERQFKKKYSAAGTHSIVCSYLGDADTYPSTAPTLTEIILDPTTTVLATSGSPSHVGQSVTFTATVTSKYGSIPNGDLVVFAAGANTLCSVPISAGTATCTTSFAKAKTYSIKAQYAGDSTFAESLGKVTQVVEP